jgi:hypothetical protein
MDKSSIPNTIFDIVNVVTRGVPAQFPRFVTAETNLKVFLWLTPSHYTGFVITIAIAMTQAKIVS